MSDGSGEGDGDGRGDGHGDGPGDVHGNGARTLVVDDHPLVRAGMRRALEGLDGVGAVDEAGSGELALRMLGEAAYGLVMLDLALPGISGVEVARRALERWPDARVIVVTGAGDAAPVRPLVAAGVAGWLTKGADAAEIGAAVRAVLAGGRHLEHDVAQRLLLEGIDGGGEASPFERLSPRELEVCRLVVDGVPNRRIGEALHISEKTVSTHRTRALDKLGVASVPELVRLALHHGLWTEPGIDP